MFNKVSSYVMHLSLFYTFSRLIVSSTLNCFLAEEQEKHTLWLSYNNNESCCIQFNIMKAMLRIQIIVVLLNTNNS